MNPPNQLPRSVRWAVGKKLIFELVKESDLHDKREREKKRRRSLWHVRKGRTGGGRADIDAFFCASNLQPSELGTSSYLFLKNVKFNCRAYFVLRISSMVASLSFVRLT